MLHGFGQLQLNYKLLEGICFALTAKRTNFTSSECLNNFTDFN